MSKRIILLFISMMLISINSAFASKLPEDVWKYIKQNLPNAQQRFDSVVVITDDIMYIPLYPPSKKDVDAIAIDYVYPQNQTLKQYPEVVLFNNGYSLLKVFKDEKGNYSLTKKDDLPLKVRLGLMPQDMLTPVGLKMPDSLKLTLGDLLIPSKEDNSLVYREEQQQGQNINSPTVKRNEFVPCVEFKNKKTFVNPRNSKFLEVYDSTSQTPLYELKLSSMPLKILTSETSKIALVLYWNSKNIEIIDLKDDRVVATIPIDSNPTDAVLNKKDNLAYITSQNANSIYVIDMSSMQLQKAIKLDQKPSKIAYCDEDNSIAFYDEYSSKIFNLTKEEDDYQVQALGPVPSISKILCDNKYVFALSRIQSELFIFSKDEQKLLNTVETDKKPTDAIVYGNKLFILCAREGYMDVYDIAEGKIISREQLAKEGFYSNMTLIPSDNNIMITGIRSKNYLLYNIDTMKLVKKQESYVDVANIIILDNSQRL